MLKSEWAFSEMMTIYAESQGLSIEEADTTLAAGMQKHWEEIFSLLAESAKSAIETSATLADTEPPNSRSGGCSLRSQGQSYGSQH